MQIIINQRAGTFFCLGRSTNSITGPTRNGWQVSLFLKVENFTETNVGLMIIIWINFNVNWVKDTILFKCKTIVTVLCSLRHFICYMYEHNILISAFTKCFHHPVSNWIYSVCFLFNLQRSMSKCYIFLLLNCWKWMLYFSV